MYDPADFYMTNDSIHRLDKRKPENVAEKMIKELLVPLPKSQKSGQPEGYGNQERKQMERLIDGSSNQ